MSYLRKYYQQKANDTLENQIERAQRAVDNCPEEYKEWCQALLDILKQCRFATIVQRIAYTSAWASFFDVFNLIHKFDTSILPVEAEELGIKRQYSKLFDK